MSVIRTIRTFTENSVRVGFIRLEKGAALTIGTQTAPQVYYLWKGAISYGGKVYGPETGFAVEANEGRIEIKGAELSEICTIQLPTFDEIAKSVDRPRVESAA